MAAPCSVCVSFDLDSIDRALVGRETVTRVAERYGLSRSAVTRHRERHVSAALAAVRPVEGAVVPAVARSVVDRVEALVGRAEAIMATAEAEASTAKALSAMSECRRLLELVAKLRGDLDERPVVQVVNLATDPTWVATRTKIMLALEKHPAARAAVVEALR